MSIDREEYLFLTEEQLLVGSLILSEWSTLLSRDADKAFVSGADLATILVAQATIECHLRYSYFSGENKKLGFYDLIERSPIPADLKEVLHKIRKYRNRWVHVNDPHEDQDLLDRPAYYENEMEEMAFVAITAMLKVIYFEQDL